MLLAHCTSYAKSHFCRQKENWHQIHCFLNPSSATASKDSPGFSTRFSEAFQTIYFLCATEGKWSDRPQMSASNEQITQVQSPFLRLKTRSTCSASLQILDSLTTVPENAKTDVTKRDLSTAESQPHTSYLQGCRTWRRNQTLVV